jgi:(p)ppGpp synthase/HD superfamily hydrolase
MLITDQYDRALAFASALHRTQTRKGTNIPYISHLMAVSSLVMEYGGNEDQSIAGLLHDSIEDQAVNYGGVDKLRSYIAAQFGQEVLRIVNACTDAEVTPKPPWQDRKQAYIRHIRDADSAVALVSCCDKLHNARAIVADLRVLGDELFGRFTASKDQTLWYYRSLAEAFGVMSIAPAEEFGRTVAEMERLSAR